MNIEMEIVRTVKKGIGPKMVTRNACFKHAIELLSKGYDVEEGIELIDSEYGRTYCDFCHDKINLEKFGLNKE